MNSQVRDLGYKGIIEDIYLNKHPEIVKWTTFFHNAVQERKIFDIFHKNLPKNFITARKVSTAWYAFSEFMPWFLCFAASKVSSNLARHYVIQGAFEELGMRDYRQIHSDIFWNAARAIGIDTPDSLILHHQDGVSQCINHLKNKLFSYSCEMQIFGILLGLEIPAIENIETLYKSMSYDNFSAEKLNEEIFFIIHREVESEHIRLTVSNFLRFQKSQQDRDNFVRGFGDGINFWEMYWKEVKAHVMR